MRAVVDGAAGQGEETEAHAGGVLWPLWPRPPPPTAAPAPLCFSCQDTTTGRLAPWSLLLFAPYHLALRSKLALQRSRSNEPLWNEVAPGWFLGGWPPSDGALPPGAGAVLDVTAELPRAAAGGGREYACFRVWDTHAPSPAALDAAVRWARKQRAGGAGVYVHCAHGHGRSAAVLAACLLDQGAATDVDGAVGVLRTARPRARLNHRQRGAVEAWWAEREGGKGR